MNFRLNQVTVPALDVAASVAFYEQLGLQLIVSSAPRYARLESPGGGATLSIHQVEALPIGTGTIIYFECADLDEWVDRLKSKGIAFQTPVVDQPWLWREAALEDPAGNAVILYFAAGNRRFPPWRIG
jgi:predicted enzyme related to lactoylglutathione lyase